MIPREFTPIKTGYCTGNIYHIAGYGQEGEVLIYTIEFSQTEYFKMNSITSGIDGAIKAAEALESCDLCKGNLASCFIKKKQF